MSVFEALGLHSRVPYHFLATAVAIGGPAFYSFVASPIMFKKLPREEFGKVQSEIFPTYFLAQTFAPVVLRALSPFRMCPISSALLIVSSLGGALNYLWLLPKCHAIKEQRKALQDAKKDVQANGEPTERYAALTKQFGMFHGISTLINMALILAVGLYGVFVSRGLVRMQ